MRLLCWHTFLSNPRLLFHTAVNKTRGKSSRGIWFQSSSEIDLVNLLTASTYSAQPRSILALYPYIWIPSWLQCFCGRKPTSFEVMRVFEGFLLAWSTLVIHVFASPQLQVENRPLLHRDRDANSSTLLPPPSADPWFQPPADWQLKTPGSVLKVRKSPYSNITIANCIDTFQVQYRTTDTHNNASWAVSTQFIPASHAKCNATHPELCAHGIVSYEIPYDSADPDATPSTSYNGANHTARCQISWLADGSSLSLTTKGLFLPTAQAFKPVTQPSIPSVPSSK
jgi:hypothetical protein